MIGGIAGGQQLAGPGPTRLQEVQPHRRAAPGDSRQDQVAVNRGQSAVDRKPRDDDLAGVGVMDPDHRLVSAHGDDPLIDREGSDRRRHVAAVAAVINQRLRDRHLRKGVVDIRVGPGRRSDHADLR